MLPAPGTEDIATSVQGQQGATSGAHAERLTAKCSRSLRRQRRRALEECREMPASARVPNMAALLGIVLVWSMPRLRWAPTNPGSIAVATEIRRASGVAETTIANLPVR